MAKCPDFTETIIKQEYTCDLRVTVLFPINPDGLYKVKSLTRVSRFRSVATVEKHDGSTFVFQAKDMRFTDILQRLCDNGTRFDLAIG